MNNVKIKFINFGLSFMQSLLYRQLRIDIENMSLSDEREYLLLKWEEGKVFPSKEDKINLLREITSSHESLNDFDKLLKEKILHTSLFVYEWGSLEPFKMHDYFKQSGELGIGSFSYISSIIYIIKLAFAEIEEDSDKLEIIAKLHPLIKESFQMSKKLKIKSPKLKQNEIEASNLQNIQSGFQMWWMNLKSSASMEKEKDIKIKLIFRGLIRGIPYIGHAIDALIFGKQ